MEWLGPAVAAGFVAIHLWRFAHPGEWRLLAACTAAGIAIDSAQGWAGVLRFAGGGLACPLWLAALWCGFGATLAHALGWLRGSAAIAVALGAVGGPLSYWAGARLGAIGLHPQLWPSLVCLAVVWGAAMPLLVRAGGRLVPGSRPGP